MASQNYKRVSRKRVCRICGKPDWCSYTPDEKTSFCARIVESADRVSRTGWGVFYHEKSLFPVEQIPFPRRSPLRRPKLAPLEIRDFAYRTLIKLAPATDSKEIIDGPKGLRTRKILDFENYGSLPQKQAERRELAKEIRRLINQNFPDYVREQKSSVAGLPGFWLDKRGAVQLWLEKDYSCPLLLIPYRDANEFIQACQIRFMCRKSENVRYVWLSTPEKSDNLGCGSPLHFAAYESGTFGKPVLVTEGALKAATVRVFKTDYDILASGGVSCSHEEIVASSRRRLLLIAFDSDYYENLHVARASVRLLESLYHDAATFGYQPRIEILTWTRNIKGIDDALLQDADIIHQTPFQWYQSLAKICQDGIDRTLALWTVKKI